MENSNKRIEMRQNLILESFFVGLQALEDLFFYDVISLVRVTER